LSLATRSGLRIQEKAAEFERRKLCATRYLLRGSLPVENQGQERVKKLKAAVFEGIENVSLPEVNRV
jgi:hypothetical protein